jgi:hypothetical protein
MENRYRFEMRMHPRPWGVLRVFLVAVAGVAFAVLFALFFGWLVMLLWNWLVPGLFGLKAISYWQAFGITVLAKILFSGFHAPLHKPHGPWRHHLGHYHRWIGGDTPRDQECFGRFSNEDMKYYRDFWKERGEASFEEYLKTVRGRNAE